MTMPAPRLLLIEGSDFESFPVGGHLSMARSLMKIFGNRLGLVGMSRPGTPVGRWIQREIDGTSYMFLSTCTRKPSASKPLIPARLQFYAALCSHKSKILSLGCKAAFTQAAEAILAISDWGWEHLSFNFAGTENPLAISRYWYAKPLRGLFDRFLFSALDSETTIFVTADENAYPLLQSRSKGRLTPERIRQLPTCVDTSEFFPIPVMEARAQLGISRGAAVFVNHGRIGRYKGWELLLDAFQEFQRNNVDAQLFFVGDGEDRPALQSRIDELGLHGRATITGFQGAPQIRTYLNASDAAVFGSFAEGWSTAMLEALACGKPIVSTRVSGAATLIIPGKNGFILDSRDPILFAGAMKRAIQLPGAHSVSTSIATEFDLPHLGNRIADACRSLKETEPLRVATPVGNGESLSD